MKESNYQEIMENLMDIGKQLVIKAELNLKKGGKLNHNELKKINEALDLTNQAVTVILSISH